MTRHIGAEALARYREGDLGSRKSARIRAHLAGCSRCATMDEDLVGVTALLASAPAPAMPDQVTSRIRAALTAEAARMAETAPVTAVGVGHQPGRSRQPPGPAKPRQSRHAAGRDGARRRLRLPELRSQLAMRALATVAVAAVIAGGIYGFAQLTPAGQSGATSSEARGAAGIGQRSAAGLSGPTLHYRSGGKLASFTPVSTHTNFRQRQLASQVSSALLQSSRSLPGSGKLSSSNRPNAQPVPAGGSLHGTSFGGIAVKNLQACVTRIAAGSTVRLVDVDRYQGKRATIIVVAGGAGGAGGSRIFVVGPGCSGSESDLIAQASLPGAG